MSNNELYVVTGVSGRTGSVVAQTLLNAGHRVRVIVRDEAKGNIWKGQGADVALADFMDIPALTTAFSGASGAYIVSPQQYTSNSLFAQADQMASTIAEASVKANLPKLVALSSVGANRSSGAGWIAMNRMLEQHLLQTGLPVTLVRAAYFIENWGLMLSTVTKQQILTSFLSPLDQKIPMVATADIGRIAAEALLEEWKGQRIIELEGKTTYSPNDVAEAFGRALNKTVQAVVAPESNWHDMLLPLGFSEAAITGFTEMTQSLNEGYLAPTGAANIDQRRGNLSLDTVINIMVKSS